MSDAEKLALGSIIILCISLGILIAVMLFRSRIVPSHRISWQSIELIEVMSTGKLGVSFMAHYRGLQVSLKVSSASLAHEYMNTPLPSANST
jgi:hypothetical protein